MKLWLLTPNNSSDVWEPWYDKAFGFVIRAKNEQTARDMAAKECGQEGPEVWLDSTQSDCEPLRKELKRSSLESSD